MYAPWFSIPVWRAQGSWFIVCEMAAWHDDPHYLARQGCKGRRGAGMDETTSSWYRIATIIHEGLPDLDPHAVPAPGGGSWQGHYETHPVGWPDRRGSDTGGGAMIETHQPKASTENADEA